MILIQSVSSFDFSVDLLLFKNSAIKLHSAFLDSCVCPYFPRIMTDARIASIDAAGILLLVEKGPPLYERLQAHQNQLDHFTEVSIKLVQHIRTQSPPPLSRVSLPAASTYLVYVPTHHTSLLEQYEGDPASYRNFLLECVLYFAEFPEISAFIQ